MSYRYIIAFSVIIGILVLLDIYTWRGIKKTVSKNFFLFFKWFIPSTTFLFILGFAVNVYRGDQGIHNAHYLLNITTGFTFGVFLAKLIIAAPFLIEDVFRYPIFVYNRLKTKKAEKVYLPSRRKFVRNISLSLAAIPLAGTIYAITRGKYNYEVKNIPLRLKNLPKSFEGLKVLQFSDFHAGSFDDYKAVEFGLSLINKQKPDVVLFTGDLVNNRAVESDPFIDMLSRIEAPIGKFAILGNHDYGEYMPFESEEEKQENSRLLEKAFEKSGFHLMLNENVQLERNGEIINLIGVENWGKPPFPQFGDLDRATKGIDQSKFNILLSHDPDHWEYEARQYPVHFDLTLSGHTHGAQFGVDIPGWQWSPVKYRYKRWLGLYKEDDQYLYVSKGFGFLGFPGRIGMSPEVVCFEFESMG
ncbi:MAG: phosphoesterase [Fluviicola sp.]|nr:MAG: phosphoesterase [Fluviicola sp.]